MPKPSRRANGEKESSEAEETRLGWRMAGLAFMLSSEVAAGALIGWTVDHFAGTAPRWLTIGAIGGIAVGMLSFIRGGLALNRLVTKNEAGRRLPKPLAPEPEGEERLGLNTEDNENRTEDTERD